MNSKKNIHQGGGGERKRNRRKEKKKKNTQGQECEFRCFFLFEFLLQVKTATTPL